MEAIAVDTGREWLVSVARDKHVRVHDVSGREVASLTLPGTPSSMAYDARTLSVFVGDTKGRIFVLRIETDSRIKQLSVLEGHACALPVLYSPAHRTQPPCRACSGTPSSACS